MRSWFSGVLGQKANHGCTHQTPFKLNIYIQKLETQRRRRSSAMMIVFWGKVFPNTFDPSCSSPSVGVGGCFKISDSFVGVELNWSLANPTPFQLVFLSAHHEEGWGELFSTRHTAGKAGSFFGHEKSVIISKCINHMKKDDIYYPR